MHQMTKLALIAAAFGAQAASAATFNLSLTADNGSRWYEYFSNVYAELGANHPQGGDGFFDIDTKNPIGSGVEVFPDGDNFLNIGTLTYNELTGAVTGLTLNFSRYVADDDSVANVGYTTALSNVLGTVTQSGGKVSGINLNSNIKFTYQTFAGNFDYNGTFAFAGNRFTLAVDQTNASGFGDFRYRWDVTGGVQNLAAAVPEPSTYVLMLAGLATAGVIARRRRAV